LTCFFIAFVFQNLYVSCNNDVPYVLPPDGSWSVLVPPTECQNSFDLQQDVSAPERTIYLGCGNGEAEAKGALFAIDPTTLAYTRLITTGYGAGQARYVSQVARDPISGALWMKSAASVGKYENNAYIEMATDDEWCTNGYSGATDMTHRLVYMGCNAQMYQYLIYKYDIDSGVRSIVSSEIYARSMSVNAATGDLLVVSDPFVWLLRYGATDFEKVATPATCVSPSFVKWSLDGKRAMLACQGSSIQYPDPAQVALFPVPIRMSSVELVDGALVRSSPVENGGTPVSIQLTSSGPVATDVNVQLGCDHDIPLVVFPFKAGDTESIQTLELNNINATIFCSFGFDVGGNTAEVTLPANSTFTARAAGAAVLTLTGLPSAGTVLAPGAPLVGMALSSAVDVASQGLSVLLECKGDNGFAYAPTEAFFQMGAFTPADFVSGQSPSSLTLLAPAQTVTCTLQTTPESDPDFVTGSPFSQFTVLVQGLLLNYTHDEQVSGASVLLTLAASPPTIDAGTSFAGELICVDGDLTTSISFAIDSASPSSVQNLVLALGPSDRAVSCAFNASNFVGTGLFLDFNVNLLPVATIAVKATSNLATALAPYGSRSIRARMTHPHDGRQIATALCCKHPAAHGSNARAHSCSFLLCCVCLSCQSTAISTSYCITQGRIFVHPVTNLLVEGCQSIPADGNILITKDTAGSITQLAPGAQCVTSRMAVSTADGAIYAVCHGASTSAVVKVFNGSTTEVLGRSSVCLQYSAQSIAIDEVRGDVYVACMNENVFKIPDGTGATPGAPIALFDAGECTNVQSLEYNSAADLLLAPCNSAVYALQGGVKTVLATTQQCIYLANDVSYDASTNIAYIACYYPRQFDFNTGVGSVVASLSLDLCSNIFAVYADAGDVFWGCSYSNVGGGNQLVAQFQIAVDSAVATAAPVVISSCAGTPRGIRRNHATGTIYATCYDEGVIAWDLLPTAIALANTTVVSTDDSQQGGSAVSVQLVADPPVTVATAIVLQCDNSLPPVTFAFDASASSAVALLPLTGLNAVVSCSWSFDASGNVAGALLPAPLRFAVRSPSVALSLQLVGLPADLTVLAPGGGLSGLQLVLPTAPISSEGLVVEAACAGSKGFALTRAVFTIAPFAMGGADNVEQDENTFQLLASAQDVTCNFSVSVGSDAGFVIGAVFATVRVTLGGVQIDGADVLVKAGTTAQLTVHALPTAIAAGDSFTGTLNCTAQADSTGAVDGDSQLTVVTLSSSQLSQTVSYSTRLGFGAHSVQCSFVSGSVSSTGAFATLSSDSLPQPTFNVAATSYLLSYQNAPGSADFVTTVLLSNAQCNPNGAAPVLNLHNNSLLLLCREKGLLSMDRTTGALRTVIPSGGACGENNLRTPVVDPVNGRVYVICLSPAVFMAVDESTGAISTAPLPFCNSIQRMLFNPVTRTVDTSCWNTGVTRWSSNLTTIQLIPQSTLNGITGLGVHPITGTIYVSGYEGIYSLTTAGVLTRQSWNIGELSSIVVDPVTDTIYLASSSSYNNGGVMSVRGTIETHIAAPRAIQWPQYMAYSAGTLFIGASYSTQFALQVAGAGSHSLQQLFSSAQCTVAYVSSDPATQKMFVACNQGAVYSMQITSQLFNGTILGQNGPRIVVQLASSPAVATPVAVNLRCDHGVSTVRFELTMENVATAAVLDLSGVGPATVTCNYEFDASSNGDGVLLPPTVRFTVRPPGALELKVTGLPAAVAVLPIGGSVTGLSLVSNVTISISGVQVDVACSGSAGYSFSKDGLFVLPAFTDANVPLAQTSPLSFPTTPQTVTCTFRVAAGGDIGFAAGLLVGSFSTVVDGVVLAAFPPSSVPSGSSVPLSLETTLTSIPSGSAITVQLVCTDSIVGAQTITFTLDSTAATSSQSIVTALGPAARSINCVWSRASITSSGAFSGLLGAMLPSDFSFSVRATVHVLNVDEPTGPSVRTELASYTDVGYVYAQVYDAATHTSYIGSDRGVFSQAQNGSLTLLLDPSLCYFDGNSLVLRDNFLYLPCDGSDDDVQAGVVKLNLADNSRTVLATYDECRAGGSVAFDASGTLWVACYETGLVSISTSGTVAVALDTDACSGAYYVSVHPTTNAALVSCQDSSSLLSYSNGVVRELFNSTLGCQYPSRVIVEQSTGAQSSAYLVTCNYGSNSVIRLIAPGVFTQLASSTDCQNPVELVQQPSGEIVVACSSSGVISIRGNVLSKLLVAQTDGDCYPNALIANSSSAVSVACGNIGTMLLTPPFPFIGLTNGSVVSSDPLSDISGPAISLKLASVALADAPFIVQLQCDNNLPAVNFSMEPLPVVEPPSEELVAATRRPQYQQRLSQPRLVAAALTATAAAPVAVSYAMTATAVLPLNGLNGEVSCSWSFADVPLSGVLLPSPVHFTAHSRPVVVLRPRLTLIGAPNRGAAVAAEGSIDGMTLRSNKTTGDKGIVVDSTCSGSAGYSFPASFLFNLRAQTPANMSVRQSTPIRLPSIPQAITCTFNVRASSSDAEAAGLTIPPVQVVIGLQPAGSACFVTENCQTSLRCNSFTSHCAVGATAGNACGVSGDCASGNTCSGGVCIAPPALPTPPVLPPSPYVQAVSATMSLVLSIDASNITPELKVQIIADLMLALQLTIERIANFNLSPGSVIATFTVLPSADPTAVTPEAALQSLQAQIADPTSVLLSLNFTQYSQELTGVSYAAIPLCANGQFADDCSSYGGNQPTPVDQFDGSSSGLSKGAKIGIIIGCVVGGVLLIALFAFLSSLRIAKKTQQQTQSETNFASVGTAAQDLEMSQTAAAASAGIAKPAALSAHGESTNAAEQQHPRPASSPSDSANPMWAEGASSSSPVAAGEHARKDSAAPVVIHMHTNADEAF
jgi:hypothetical protein